MGDYDDETDVEQIAEGRWVTEMSTAWHIGDTANGGYVLAPVLRSIAAVAGDHPHPLSVTTHFLRPVREAGPATIEVELVRRGRIATVCRATLSHGGQERMTVLATYGDLDTAVGGGSEMSLPPPDAPGPDECFDRRALGQGVELPILDRLDVRIHPDLAEPGGSPDAVMAGWIRFADGTEPSPPALTLFADAFPPTLYSKFGRVGWVPTLELTVHVRRRPAPGWVQARFECDDLAGGRMVETGALWDSTGALVARSRQLGVLLTDGP